MLYMDNRVEATRTTDIGLITDNNNPVALYKAQPSISSRETHFKGLFELDEHVDRVISGCDLNKNSQ